MFQGNQGAFDQGKGKGKLKEADFEAAFAQVSASFGPQSATTSRIEEVKDDVSNVEELMKNTTLDEAKTENQTDFKQFVMSPLQFDFPANSFSVFGISCKTLMWHRRKKSWPNGRQSSTKS